MAKLGATIGHQGHGPVAPGTRRGRVDPGRLLRGAERKGRRLVENDPPITPRSDGIATRGAPFAAQRAMTLRGLVRTHRPVQSPPIEASPPERPDPSGPGAPPRRRALVLTGAAGAVLVGAFAALTAVPQPARQTSGPGSDTAPFADLPSVRPSWTARLESAPTRSPTAPPSDGPPPGSTEPPAAFARRVPPPAASPSPPKGPTGEPNPAGNNLALRQPADASTVQGLLWSPGRAFDGSELTRWSSEFADPQWLQVDLGANRLVSEVRLVWERAYATKYRVETSLDGSTWSPLYATETGTGGAVVIDGEPTVARYVRMYGIERSSQYGYSLLEFEIR